MTVAKCPSCVEYEKTIENLRIRENEIRASHFNDIVELKKYRPMKVFLRIVMSLFFVIWMIVNVAGVAGPLLGIAFFHFPSEWGFVVALFVFSCIVWFFSVMDVVSSD